MEDDADPSTLTDVWNGYDHSINGATYTTSATEGSYALDCDGTDDYTAASSSISEIEDVAEFSIALWANPDSFGESQNPAFVAQGDSWDNSIAIYDSGSNVNYDVRNGGTIGSVSVDTANYSTSAYEMYTLTFGSSTVEAYLNDSSMGTASGPSRTSTISNAFELGRNTWTSAYKSTLIDDVRVFDKELTSTEVSNLYSTGSISG